MLVPNYDTREEKYDQPSKESLEMESLSYLQNVLDQLEIHPPNPILRKKDVNVSKKIRSEKRITEFKDLANISQFNSFL